MRFKNQRTGPSMPAIDLIPMLNVMMAVLAFFVMISTTLTSEQGVDIQLPSGERDSETQPEQSASLIVQLNPQGQIVVRKQTVTPEQLASQVKAYLQQNEQGIVQLIADPKVPYEQVVQLLGEMKALGGDRVSLAIESE